MEKDDAKWTPETEIALFKAMQDHKPVGLNKHWHMLCIQHHMITQGGVVIPSSEIWHRLHSLYDMAALEERNTNSVAIEELEFELPPLFFEGQEETEEVLPRKRMRNSTSPSPTASPLPPSKKKRTQ